jgi:hypothetical protein
MYYWKCRQGATQKDIILQEYSTLLDSSMSHSTKVVYSMNIVESEGYQWQVEK